MASPGPARDSRLKITRSKGVSPSGVTEAQAALEPPMRCAPPEPRRRAGWRRRRWNRKRRRWWWFLRTGEPHARVAAKQSSSSSLGFRSRISFRIRCGRVLNSLIMRGPQILPQHSQHKYSTNEGQAATQTKTGIVIEESVCLAELSSPSEGASLPQTIVTDT